MSINDAPNPGPGAEGTLTGTATQSAHPWRATFRTFLAVAVPLIVLLPSIMPALVDWATEYTDLLPGWATAAIIGTAAVVAAAASLVTRLLAIPGLESWLREHLSFLAAAPKTERLK